MALLTSFALAAGLCLWLYWRERQNFRAYVDGRTAISTIAVQDALVAARWIGRGTTAPTPRPVMDAWGAGGGKDFRRTAAAMVAAEMRNALQPITTMLDDRAPENEVMAAVERLTALASALTTSEPSE